MATSICNQRYLIETATRLLCCFPEWKSDLSSNRVSIVSVLPTALISIAQPF